MGKIISATPKVPGRYDSDDRIRAMEILNSICDELSYGEYKQGRRNDLAVDLVCCCWVLGLNAEEIAKEAMGDHWNVKVKDDLDRRIVKIEEYCPWWDSESDGVFSKMLNEWYWDQHPSDSDWVVAL